MLRKILTAAIAVIASATCTCASAQDATSTLEQAVAEANATCPIVSQGISVEAIRLIDNALVIDYVMDIPAAQFPILKQNMDMMRPTLLQQFISDNSMRNLCRLVSESDRELRIVISCRHGSSASLSINYSANELADALK